MRVTVYLQKTFEPAYLDNFTGLVNVSQSEHCGHCRCSKNSGAIRNRSVFTPFHLHGTPVGAGGGGGDIFGENAAAFAPQHGNLHVEVPHRRPGDQKVGQYVGDDEDG